MRMPRCRPVSTRRALLCTLFTHCTTVRDRISRLRQIVSHVLFVGCDPRRFFLFWGIKMRVMRRRWTSLLLC